MVNRDDQPASPWRPEPEDAALIASAWPSEMAKARARSELSQIRQTLERAKPPEPKRSRPAAGMRRTG